MSPEEGLVLHAFSEATRVSLFQAVPEETSKHCIAGGISRRLAGYWEKFSISNHHASVKPHRLW